MAIATLATGGFPAAASRQPDRPTAHRTRAGARTAVHRTPMDAHMAINCEYSDICTDLADSQNVFGQYVGHDVPANAFFSNVPGSGNRNQYNVILPRDPSPSNPAAKSYQFELSVAFWFGMAMCATQSYPEQIPACTPDSDSNILDPATSPDHTGTAFMQLEFFPPGWVEWPRGGSCSPAQWCVAFNINSLAVDPVNGTVLNSTCAAKVGLEYLNFAFVTRNGKPQAPPNPVQSTLATFTPDPAKDLFMNPGDHLVVTTHDTPAGLEITISDLTTGQSGSMTASAANGFAQVKYDPTGTSCQSVPYSFHPMYSTSTPQTRVIWSAHSFSAGFFSEIGDFQDCSGPNPIPPTPTGVQCPSGDFEGSPPNLTPTDADDSICFPGSEASLIDLGGCLGTNTGFDGPGYQPDWPDGNTLIHPQPVLFSSPLTGSDYDIPYAQSAFETDLAKLEGGSCATNGTGCTLIPTTDSGTPAAFYPFFSTFQRSDDHDQGCLWGLGNAMPRGNDFGRNNQYGQPLPSTYLIFGGGGSASMIYDDFRQIVNNPCPPGGYRR
ncbi:MAG TPA: hypothetical protein VGI74_03075 [Streptosporangiaceae bacterium]